MLRQYAPEITERPATLFTPEEVIRPVTPAVVDFYLTRQPEKVTLDIRDAQGSLVRTFEPKSHAGSNRFVWDLRYPGAVTFPGLILRYAVPGQGPFAPPGEYSVRLIANGITETKPLIVRRDPRLTDITDADLEAQFKLAIAIRDETARANTAIIQIRSLQQQLVERERDPETKQLAATIASKLDEIEQDLYQTKNRSPRDTLNYPIKLNNQLAVLQTAVDTGENKPTDQEYAVFEELKAHLNQILARFDQVLSKDLPPLQIKPK
jgi:hypothetical protein